MTTWSRETADSAEWLAAVESPLRILSSRVEMLDVRDDVAGVIYPDSVTVDYDEAKSEAFAAAFTFSDPASVPLRTADATSPLSGLKARVWWQVQTSGGVVEYPACTVYLEDPDMDYNGLLSMTLDGRDAVAEAKRGGYRGTTVSVGGMTVTAALALIFQTVAPGIPSRVAASAVALPAIYDLGAKLPEADWTEIAALAGFVVRADRLGVIVAGPPAVPESVRLSLAEGDGCAATRIRRSVSTSTMINRAVAVSTSTEIAAPIMAVCEDTDPGSPLWVGLGRNREKVVTSDAITTQEAADNLAQSTYAAGRSALDSIEVTMPQRPDMEGGDIASVSFPAIGAAGNYRIAAYRYAMRGPDKPPEQMTVRMRPKAVQW